jgi:hypothetical protein
MTKKITDPLVIEGTVSISWGGRKDNACTCCKGGRHAFGLGVKLPSPADDRSPRRNGYDDHIHDFLYDLRDKGIDGRRVRITVEVL